MAPRATVLVLGLTLAAPAAFAQRHARLVSRIDSLAAEILRLSPTPGLSVAVMRGRDTIIARGYGLARLADSTPATRHTVYPVASITKQFTAAAVLRLVERHRVRLGEPVGRYLPGFATTRESVTLGQLLTHTSGLALLPLLDGPAPPDEAVDPDRVLAFLRDTPPASRPGTLFAYSNTGYYLLGSIVERVTGRPFAAFLRDSVLLPAGLVHTDFCAEHDSTAATGYMVRDGYLVPAGRPLPAPGFAAGGLCSTVVDLVAWARAVGGRKVVNNMSWGLMTEPVELKDGSRASYGLGVNIGHLEQHRVIGHGGATPGFSSQLAYYPDDDLAIAVLANSDDALTRRLSDQIARAVLGMVEPLTRDLALVPGQEARYVGTYRFQGDSTIVHVQFRAGHLHAQLGDGEPFRLLFQGTHEFAVESDPATRVFFRTQGGPAKSLEFRSGGLMSVADRYAAPAR